MQTIRVKRGDTWILTADASSAGVPTDLSSITVTSQIRASADSSVIATWTIAESVTVTGRYTMTIAAATTAAITPATYLCDVQYTDGGGVVYSTETFAIQVDADITHA